MWRVGLALCLVVSSVWGGERSAAARAAFVRENPCPAVGAEGRRCPGYVVDHVVPLCLGGEDAPRNMQWQAVREAREKDREEWRACRARRQGVTEE